jgi:hypothetical protein
VFYRSNAWSFGRGILVLYEKNVNSILRKAKGRFQVTIFFFASGTFLFPSKIFLTKFGIFQIRPENRGMLDQVEAIDLETPEWLLD